jgi:phospholipase B1
MAGFGMENYIPGLLSFLLSPQLSTEYRGRNFVSGADPGVPTFANFLKHYNPNIKGGSVGWHGTHICYGPCPKFLYNSRVDNLNAARSGARSTGLMSQIDYLEEGNWEERDNRTDRRFWF